MGRFCTGYEAAARAAIATSFARFCVATSYTSSRALIRGRLDKDRGLLPPPRKVQALL